MSLRNSLRYLDKCLGIYIWNILQWINRHVLLTYPLIEDCARCQDCGRNVHDYHVPDNVWLAVIGSSNGVWCYDCFCNRADEKLGMKWRMDLAERWRTSEYPYKKGDELEVSTESERFQVLYCVDCEERFSLDMEHSVIRYMNLKHPRSITPLKNADRLLNEGKCAWCGGELIHEWAYRLGKVFLRRAT